MKKEAPRAATLRLFTVLAVLSPRRVGGGRRRKTSIPVTLATKKAPSNPQSRPTNAEIFFS